MLHVCDRDREGKTDDVVSNLIAFKLAINSLSVLDFQSEYRRGSGVVKFLLCFYQSNGCMKQQIVTVCGSTIF